jgi:muramoyltetrapeptide carboxypeptidase
MAARRRKLYSAVPADKRMHSAKKPKALTPGTAIRLISPASGAPREALERGIAELKRLGFSASGLLEGSETDGYFAAPEAARFRELCDALKDSTTRALIATRGGYGSNYLIDALAKSKLHAPKIVMGYSDLTSLFIWLWQKHRWVTFHGPMVASGFDAGSNASKGYDEHSFLRAVTQTRGGWELDLGGEQMVAGTSRGVLLGGCLTLLQTSLGTPWELDTRGAILAIEDRGMKPYQVDRALMHLQQAGKFEGVRGIVLGEFPDCVAPESGSPCVRDVCHRMLRKLKIPIIWGARFGHTSRPMLTLPLGVRVRLETKGSSTLEILEPAVI